MTQQAKELLDRANAARIDGNNNTANAYWLLFTIAMEAAK